jgi:hypothetical protein
MAKPRQKPGETSRLLNDLPLDVGELGVRLTQADFARLCGCSRARVSQWVQKGMVPVTASGRIDPSAGFAALLRHDRDHARLRVLHDVRRRIDDAEARAAAAEAHATKAIARLALIESRLLPLVELALHESRLVSALVDETAALAEGEAKELAHDAAIDRAFERARNPPGVLDGVADDLAALVAEIWPERFACSGAGAAAALAEEGAPPSLAKAGARGDALDICLPETGN